MLELGIWMFKAASHPHRHQHKGYRHQYKWRWNWSQRHHRPNRPRRRTVRHNHQNKGQQPTHDRSNQCQRTPPSPARPPLRFRHSKFRSASMLRRCRSRCQRQFLFGDANHSSVPFPKFPGPRQMNSRPAQNRLVHLPSDENNLPIQPPQSLHQCSRSAQSLTFVLFVLCSHHESDY